MAKKKSIRYICPCCYGNIELNQIHYACTNPECAPNFLATCSESESKRYYSEFKEGEEIDVEKSEFLGLDPYGPAAKTTRDHLIRSSPNGACDMCKSKNTLKLCPCCHTRIPLSAEKEGTKIFTVVGSDGSGKSHYLASLVSVLKTSYSEEFGIRFRDSSGKTSEKFENEYARPIDDGRCIPPTPSYTDEDSRRPLLYDVVDPESGDSLRTVAFVDTSGSDLDETDNLASLNISSYIGGSAGIVFVIDPLQVPTIREKLGLPSVRCPDVIDRIDYIADIVRDKNRLKPKDEVDVPIAIVLNKADLLIRAASGNEDETALFGPESALHIKRETGSPDLEVLEQVSIELEEYFRRNMGPEFLDAVRQFENYQFFAVSSIGSNPEEGNLIKGVAPYRVEDPVIWFLNMTERRRWF